MTIKMPHIVKPGNDDRAEAFIAGAFKAPVREAAQDDGPAKSVVNMRFDAKLLARIDAAARRQGISRTAWLHVAASKALE